MKVMKSLICGLVAGTMLLNGTISVKTKAYTEEFRSNKFEFRGVWMSSAYNIDWPQAKSTAEAQKSDYIEKIEKLAAGGFNAVMFQVRPMGDALYNSGYATWSKYLTGTQGVNPGYDPLSFALEEAHKRNLEFHAWFNPFRISAEANFNLNEYINKLPDTSPLKQHPEWIVKYSGNKTYFWINIGIPEARQYVIDTILEVVKNYNIDGVHLDDYFYPYPVYSTDSSGKSSRVDFPDNAEYAKYGTGFTNKADWRRSNVNKFVQLLSAEIKKEKAKVKFGISPFGIWKNSTSEGGAGTNGMSSFNDLFADSKAWVDNQWIDYIIPQIYWNFGYTAADYKVLTDWWSQKVAGKNVSLYIGHAAYKVGDAGAGTAWTNAAEIANQIKYNRENNNIKGSALFSARDILANKLGIYEQLKNDLYKNKALIPAMPWRDSTIPQTPTLLSAQPSENGVELKWNKSSDSDVTKYIIYRFNKGEAADITKEENILAVLPAKAEDINAYKDNTAAVSEKYVYAVTAVDVFGNESIASAFDMSFGKTIVFSADKASPQKVNSTIQLKAQVLSAGNYLCRLYVDNGTGWTLLRDYSTEDVFNWLPAVYGSYKLKLEVKDITSGAEYDAAVQIPYLVNGVYKVMVDPGHGGSDPGTSGFSGAKEKDFNLKISKKVRDLLNSRGIEVLMTREEDKSLTLPERSAMANSWKADVFVSIHQNSFIEEIKDKSGNVIGVRYPKGIETFYFTGSTQGSILAQKIQTNLIQNTRAVDRRTKTANFHVLKETDMPSALVECGFITNQEEEAKLLTDEYQNIVAKSIADGILQYFNMNGEDVDGSGIVDSTDLELVMSYYGAVRGDSEYSSAADVNNDGVVDLLDMTMVSKKMK